MSFFLDKKGNLSVIRVGLVATILGAIVIVGGILIFAIERSSYQSPLKIDTPPGAEQWGAEQAGPGPRRIVLYKVPDMTPEEVAAFYQEELDDHYNSKPSDGYRPRCVRTPLDGDMTDYVEGSGNLPYWYTCIFDRQGFTMSQTTEVRIEPGVWNQEKEIDTRGETVIRYEQAWTP
jgi:hypothetical protein